MFVYHWGIRDKLLTVDRKLRVMFKIINVFQLPSKHGFFLMPNPFKLYLFGRTSWCRLLTCRSHSNNIHTGKETTYIKRRRGLNDVKLWYPLPFETNVSSSTHSVLRLDPWDDKQHKVTSSLLNTLTHNTTHPLNEHTRVPSDTTLHNILSVARCSHLIQTLRERSVQFPYQYDEPFACLSVLNNAIDQTSNFISLSDTWSSALQILHSEAHQMSPRTLIQFIQILIDKHIFTRSKNVFLLLIEIEKKASEFSPCEIVSLVTALGELCRVIDLKSIVLKASLGSVSSHSLEEDKSNNTTINVPESIQRPIPLTPHEISFCNNTQTRSSNLYLASNDNMCIPLFPNPQDSTSFDDTYHYFWDTVSVSATQWNCAMSQLINVLLLSPLSLWDTVSQKDQLSIHCITACLNACQFMNVLSYSIFCQLFYKTISLWSLPIRSSIACTITQLNDLIHFDQEECLLIIQWWSNWIFVLNKHHLRDQLMLNKNSNKNNILERNRLEFEQIISLNHILKKMLFVCLTERLELLNENYLSQCIYYLIQDMTPWDNIQLHDAIPVVNDRVFMTNSLLEGLLRRFNPFCLLNHPFTVDIATALLTGIAYYLSKTLQNRVDKNINLPLQDSVLNKMLDLIFDQLNKQFPVISLPIIHHILSCSYTLLQNTTLSLPSTFNNWMANVSRRLQRKHYGYDVSNINTLRSHIGTHLSQTSVTTSVEQ